MLLFLHVLSRVTQHASCIKSCDNHSAPKRCLLPSVTSEDPKYNAKIFDSPSDNILTYSFQAFSLSHTSAYCRLLEQSSTMSTLQLSLNDEDPWIIEKKMFDLLSDYLQPSSTKSSEAIARALDDLFPTNRSEEDQPPDEPIEEPGSFLWHMWPLFHRVAQQIPHSNSAQDRLVELVRTLRDLPAKTPTVYLEGWSDNTYKLWEDLPLLDRKSVV